MTFDWYRRCAYDGEQKKAFHRRARTALRALAKELRLSEVSYDLRSNRGGVAVSGEITLHHERVYIQVCQPAIGADSGILIRTCEGRRDYDGGRNHFAPLSLLDHPAELAEYVRVVISGELSVVSRMFGPLVHKRLARG
ncbi:hypothetical protein [Methylocystis sp. ATCC 49242]|uniref:hypothetical protein n=1 Tax=Methylocystis sp. ATCC 49242 TaxID=622637 RepID=UPI0001F88271|nr:hypothetical protein [Methylocystis sp. ATCC 49242]